MTFFEKLWWRWMPGVTFVVQWPNGWTEIDRDMGVSVCSADPNDHYRPWLEANVGRQGRDWNWRIYALGSAYIMNAPVAANNAVEIKIRRGKEQYATLAKLRWV